MSRLSSLTGAALKAMFSTETEDNIITLLTIYASDGTTPVARLADNYKERLISGNTFPDQALLGTEGGSDILTNDSDIVYGVYSGTVLNTTTLVNDPIPYIFVPMEINLPSEEDNAAPKCSLSIHDVTRYLTPTIRNLNYSPKVKLDLVLYSTPNTVEATFSGFYITNINYTADTVTCELTMTDYAVEPFPCFTFTPQYFPGLF